MDYQITLPLAYRVDSDPFIYFVETPNFMFSSAKDCWTAEPKVLLPVEDWLRPHLDSDVLEAA